MIVLDFSVLDPIGAISREDLPLVTVGAIALELFQCSLTFVVNGVDLSWDEEIPMVDFARSLFFAASSLGEVKRSAEFISVDLLPWWRLELVNDQVQISREDLDRVGECERANLVAAAADFGVRVYDAALRAVPELRGNAMLSTWYPYEEMRRSAAV